MSTVSNLSDWFVTPLGQYVMTCEQAFYERSVTDIFGFNALQLGLPQNNLLRGNRIPLHVRAGKETGAQVWLESVELPFETGSIDLMLLPHVLEFNAHPHEILREVERVMMPEGSLLISGFNPYSLWGLRRMLGPKSDYPWSGNFISLSRLKDWLALLGFEIAEVKFACYAPPFNSTGFLKRTHFFEPTGDRWWEVGGGIYLLKAIKRVPGMRLIKPKWNGRLVRKFIPASARLNREVSQKTQHHD